METLRAEGLKAADAWPTAAAMAASELCYGPATAEVMAAATHLCECSCPEPSPWVLEVTVLNFVFCVFLSAAVSGWLVANASLLDVLREWFSERAPGLHRPAFQRVHLLGMNRVTTSELALNERGEVGGDAADRRQELLRRLGAGNGTGNGGSGTGNDAGNGGGEGEEDEPPPRVVRGCCGNRDEALRRWRATLAWREENAVNGILNEPQPLFHVIKQHFPTSIYGRGRRGQVVVYEKFGGADAFAALEEEHGVTAAVLLRHCVYLSEYIWRVVAAHDDDAQLVAVEDLKDVKFTDVTRRALDFVRHAAKTARQHYVERCQKVYIVNAPPWFGLVWNGLSPFIDARTKRKIRVLGSDLSELHKDIDPSEIPIEYGGSCRTPLTESHDERRLLLLVQTVNREYFRSRSVSGGDGGSANGGDGSRSGNGGGGGGAGGSAAASAGGSGGSGRPRPGSRRRSSRASPPPPPGQQQDHPTVTFSLESTEAPSRLLSPPPLSPPGEDFDCFLSGADVGLELGGAADRPPTLLPSLPSTRPCSTDADAEAPSAASAAMTMLAVATATLDAEPTVMPWEDIGSDGGDNDGGCNDDAPPATLAAFSAVATAEVAATAAMAVTMGDASSSGAGRAGASGGDGRSRVSTDSSSDGGTSRESRGSGSTVDGGYSGYGDCSSSDSGGRSNQSC